MLSLFKNAQRGPDRKLAEMDSFSSSRIAGLTTVRLWLRGVTGIVGGYTHYLTLDPDDCIRMVRGLALQAVAFDREPGSTGYMQQMDERKRLAVAYLRKIADNMEKGV